MVWSVREMTRAAAFVALWMVLSVFSVFLKIITHEGYLPIFYFLIWMVGLIFTPSKAFFITVTSHFMYDLIYLPNPLFVFVWIASGIVAWCIAVLRNQRYWTWILFILPPLIYLIAFFVMGYIQFGRPFDYFFVFPGITFMLLVGNPLFNFFVIIILKKRPGLVNYLQNHFQPRPQNVIINKLTKSTKNSAIAKT